MPSSHTALCTSLTASVAVWGHFVLAFIPVTNP
jgi:acid phosphatase family membrane protein YuiD